MMNDKQIIKTLDHIKGLCASHTSCTLCRFYLDNIGTNCQIAELINILDTLPTNWDMDAIERIINE